MLLELRNVDVVFDGIIQVLRSVNLDVRASKITALLGGNGAGKTTTLKAISGGSLWSTARSPTGKSALTVC